MLGAQASKLLDEELEKVLADNPMQSMGWNYVFGLGQGMVSTIAGAGGAWFDVLTDPTAGVRMAQGLLDAITDRMVSRGESAWDAANHILNPYTRMKDTAPLANELAGAAIAARNAGDPAAALALTRAAGRAAWAFGMAAADLGTLGLGAAETASMVGRMTVRRWASRRVLPVAIDVPNENAQISVRRKPEGDARMNLRNGAEHTGVTGSANYTEPATIVTPPKPPTVYYNPDWPGVAAVPGERLVLRREVARAHMDAARFEAHQTLRGLKGKARANAMRGATKRFFNAQEQLDAIGNQLMEPRNTVVINARTAGVRHGSGELVPPGQIPGMVKARVYDQVVLMPGGKARAPELKTPDAVTRSIYEQKPGGPMNTRPRAGAFRTELAKTEAIRNYAKSHPGSTIELDATTLNGDRVRINIRPDDFAETLGPYFGYEN
jgi:hypothetical protein